MNDCTTPPESDNLKKCATCGEWKPATREYFHSNGYKYLRHNCRVCHNVERRRRRTLPPDKAREEERQWQLEHPELKRCSSCKEIKPATSEYFGSLKKGRGGLRAVCRPCHNAQNELWRANNPDYFREWHKANPEKARELNNRWKLANRDKVRAIKRKWARANPDYGREWYQANRDRTRALAKCNANKRRARMRQAKGTHTAADIRKQLEGQRGKCWWCNKKIKGSYHVDHRIPLAQGGSNAPDNLVIACPDCNMSKGAKMPWEWSNRLL